MTLLVFKVVLIGCPGVGKSAIAIQFVRQQFISNYDPTIEESYRKQAAVDDIEVMLDILDTAGSEEYSAMKAMYYRSGDGFMLVYSITDSDTLSGLDKFRKDVLDVKETPNVAFVVVGNKCDIEEKRQAFFEEGHNIAMSYGAKFYETSAKKNINVTPAFYDLVREIRRLTELEKKNNIQGPQRGRTLDGLNIRCTLL